ncbi:MAG: hypothetical protein ACOVSW_00265 [Candidatus Kapaibacteriota bacterium]|jgi:hypothetical protein
MKIGLAKSGEGHGGVFEAMQVAERPIDQMDNMKAVKGHHC